MRNKLRTMHLFAGAGGGILGDILLGHHPVCAVEIEPYCQQVLSARQKDGCIPWFPIFADVKEFGGNPWRGLVDCVCGGFPCQDISCAGKGAGLNGERSGLWEEMRRIISEVRPRYAFIENSPMLTIRGGVRVIADLAGMGYDCKWGVIGAENAGAIHKRKRIWILAYSYGNGLIKPKIRECAFKSTQEKQTRKNNSQHFKGASGISSADDNVADTNKIRRKRRGRYSKPTGRLEFKNSGQLQREVFNSKSHGYRKRGEIRNICQTHEGPFDELFSKLAKPDWWTVEPSMGRVAYGVANRVDRLKSIGNGQVPACAKLAWETLS